MKTCLVCGKEKLAASMKCKLCGMGIRDEHIVSNDFVFCCMKCSRIFDTFMQTMNEKEREELIKKDVVV